MANGETPRKYGYANGLDDEKMMTLGEIVADHAIERAKSGDIMGVFRETVKGSELVQAILIELGFLVPDDEVTE